MVTCFKAVAVRMRSGGLEVCLETASAGLAGGLDSGGEGGGAPQFRAGAAVAGVGQRPDGTWDRGRGTEGSWQNSESRCVACEVS